MELKTRNVNSAFECLIGYFVRGSIHQGRVWGDRKENAPVVTRPSRNGDVLVIDEPVLVTYSHPRERVLFNAARDANPFFMLYEALWMLAGRNDVASVAYYAKQMREYSDDGKTLNGAYGYRWRQAYVYDMPPNRYKGDGFWEDGVDQLDILVNHLKADPNSRRAVLSMWNVEDDLLKIGTSKDVCCNLSVMFSLRVKPGSTVLRPDLQETHITSPHHVLDMTVTNRSNDLVWGMLGTNYVTFTILQEYMACRLGVEVGRYSHFTNNLHVYTWNWKPEEWLSWKRLAGSQIKLEWPEYVEYGGNWIGNEGDSINPEVENVQPGIKLIDDVETFDIQLQKFVDWFSSPRESTRKWSVQFFDEVANPMFVAHNLHKRGATKLALQHCDLIEADDWRIACSQWIRRRMK